ncbi:unnamed protein product [Cyclocybe aegerita]|uniref:Uncharacterized protein n=1 Tax=Cyclocybe aegerita TaxID=1973307 RepID=A0A8S0WYX9_CYCAE|nr:unnamed protein product [Cyclocybe aegerita]
MLGKKLDDAEEAANDSIRQLKERIVRLEEAVRDLTQKQVVLWKCCEQLVTARKALKKRLNETHKKPPSAFKMTYKGRYTWKAHLIACLMVSSGTAEKHVGGTLQEIGHILSVEVPKAMRKCTVHRAILEKGVAADIQLVYEILKAGHTYSITYSSDSMSHKHIEYECHTIALKVVDYSNPNAKPIWKLRTLGVGTSELTEVFNNSPLTQHEGLRFVPDDFAYRLIGTSGDHAADQKQSHEILQIWRLEVILQ